MLGGQQEVQPWSGAREGETSPRVEAPTVHTALWGAEAEYTAEPLQFLGRRSGGWPSRIYRRK